MARERDADARAPAPDYAKIAIDHLGTPHLAERLAGFATLVARFQAMERLDGALAAPGRRRLQQAARSVPEAADAFSELSLAQWLAAYGVPEVPQSTAETLAEVGTLSSGPNRMHAVLAMEAMLSTLRRVGSGLERLAARASAAGAHRPSKQETRAFALDGLESIWRSQRSDPPTQSRSRGGFGSFVEAMLSEPPVGIPANTLRKAVAARYPSRDGQRGRTASRPTPPDTEAKLNHVVIVGRARPLTIALAQEYSQHAAVVTLACLRDRGEHRVPQTVSGVRAIPLRIDRLTPKHWDREVSAADIDLLIFAEELAEGHPGSQAAPWDVDAFSWSERLGQAVTRPQQLLGAARHRLSDQARIALVTSQVGSAALASGPWDPLGETTAAALQRLAAGWAREFRGSGRPVFAICTTWGRGPDGHPMAYSHPAQTAAALRATIARLSAERTGMLLDLAGSTLPR
jgi:NAD(P)-dependent dehydrogenase (short-subunit alcohol dehydrogenase family)